MLFRSVQFVRRGEGALFCAFNLGDGQAEVMLPAGRWQAVGGELGQGAVAGKASLGPWQCCLVQEI